MKTSNKGKKVILPFFLTHAGCGERCSFCEQKVMTGISPRKHSSFDDLLERFASYLAVPDEIAIYGGDMLHMDREEIVEILDELRKMSVEELGISPPLRISASPRAITIEKLLLLKRYNVKTIEIGAVSTNEDVLKNASRGYAPRQVMESVRMVKDMGFITGIQLITGLPGDTIRRFHKTVSDVLSLKPHFAILYPLVVLRGTRLEKDFLTNRFIPHSESHILKTGALFILACMRWNVKVARIGLFDRDIKDGEILHNSFSGNLRQKAEGLAYRLMVEHLMSINGNIISLLFNKRWETSVRGERGENLDAILEMFPHLSGKISFDSGQESVVGFDIDGGEHSICADISGFVNFASSKIMEYEKS